MYFIDSKLFLFSLFHEFFASLIKMFFTGIQCISSSFLGQFWPEWLELSSPMAKTKKKQTNKRNAVFHIITDHFACSYCLESSTWIHKSDNFVFRLCSVITRVRAHERENNAIYNDISFGLHARSYIINKYYSYINRMWMYTSVLDSIEVVTHKKKPRPVLET